MIDLLLDIGIPLMVIGFGAVYGWAVGYWRGYKAGFHDALLIKKRKKK